MAENLRHYVVELNYPENKIDAIDTNKPQQKIAADFNTIAQAALHDFKADLDQEGLAADVRMEKFTIRITEFMKYHGLVFIETTEEIAEKIANFPSVLSVADAHDGQKPLRYITPRRKR